MTPARRRAKEKPPLRALGWREWVQLPTLGVGSIKAKLDSGARTSALHAFRIQEFVRDDVEMVRFEIHPVQRSSAETVQAEAEVLDRRVVRNSGGHTELRPMISTLIRIGDDEWPIELTLTRRDEMGFRMLLGRQALRGLVMIDPGSSYRAGRRPAAPPSVPPARKARSGGEAGVKGKSSGTGKASRKAKASSKSKAVRKAKAGSKSKAARLGKTRSRRRRRRRDEEE